MNDYDLDFTWEMVWRSAIDFAKESESIQFMNCKYFPSSFLVSYIGGWMLAMLA